jgi:hypothetical protein
MMTISSPQYAIIAMDILTGVLALFVLKRMRQRFLAKG